MFLIPGALIAIATFPGVIAHEWAHKKFCEITGVKVKEVCYFRLGNPAGYVVHEKPEKFHQTFAISVGPLIVNTLLALLVFFAAYVVDVVSYLTSSWFGSEILFWAVIWLGVSIGMHSFPSSVDARSLWNESKSRYRTERLALVGFPVAAFIFIASILSVAWFDLLYSLGLLFLMKDSFTYLLILVVGAITSAV